METKIKLREVDMRQLRMEETRLRAFKEKNFAACGYEEPKSAFIKIILLAICIGVLILLSLAILFT